MSNSVTIGVDLGGTNIKGGVVDEHGAVLKRASLPTEAAAGYAHVLRRIVLLIDQLLASAQLSRSEVHAFGLGAPGPIAHDAGMILGAPNLPGFVRVPIRDDLARMLQRPVVLENDANAAAYGEFAFGAGGRAPHMVLLTLGTGLGGGIVVYGRVLIGHFGTAAELGHMIVVPDGRACPCGQTGCIERYASANAVAERYVEALPDARSTPTEALAQRVRGGESITSQDVAAAARSGESLAARIWDETCLYLAQGCVNLQHILNPARVVLGGGLTEAGDQLLRPTRAHFERLTWRMAKDAPEIVLATLGGDAGIIGAAALAQSSLLN